MVEKDGVSVMTSKKENKERLKEQKKILAAYHNKEREAEKEAQGGSLPFKSRQVEEVEHKNTKKQRKISRQNLRRFMRGDRDDY